MVNEMSEPLLPLNPMDRLVSAVFESYPKEFLSAFYKAPITYWSPKRAKEIETQTLRLKVATASREAFSDVEGSHFTKTHRRAMEEFAERVFNEEYSDPHEFNVSLKEPAKIPHSYESFILTAVDLGLNDEVVVWLDELEHEYGCNRMISFNEFVRNSYFSNIHKVIGGSGYKLRKLG